MKNFGIIYKATNKINGKVYVGQTIRGLSDRKYNHLLESKLRRYNSIFHRAIKKYKPINFEWEVLEYCDSKEELNEMEFHYIKQYNSFVPNGYNLTLGGEGSCGFKVSDKTKKKISNSLRGNKSYWYGKKHSKDTIDKIKKARRNYVFTEAHRKNISESLSGKNHPNYGKKYSQELRQKLSDAHKGKNIGSDNSCSKKFVVTSPEGERFVIDGLNSFCRKYENGLLNNRHMSACARGKRRHHRKYLCRYYNPDVDSNISMWEGIN